VLVYLMAGATHSLPTVPHHACSPGNSARERALPRWSRCNLAGRRSAETWRGRAVRTPNGNGPVDPVSYLRRQAELCLLAAEACLNRAAAEDLKLMAAELHARALRIEFGALAA
jgi:hypothetical protein